VRSTQIEANLPDFVNHFYDRRALQPVVLTLGRASATKQPCLILPSHRAH
jgi:hypothetical protein